MSLRNILLGCLVILMTTSCDVLKQLAQQNQQGGGGGGNQGGTIQMDGPVDCNSGNRYTQTIFPANAIKKFENVPYASMTAADQWNGGKNTDLCYGGRPYKYNTEGGKEELRLDIYMPDPSVDQCRSRSLVIFVHQGGFAPVYTPSKSMNTIAGRAKFLAQLGFVVAVIDYRKGFDFKTNTYHPNSIAYQVMPQLTIDCSEASKPDPNSFQVAMFRFIQDIRASHRFLHKNKDLMGTDNNKIFYLGLSTGAIGIAHAAYAADETQHWNQLGLGSVQSFGQHPELEGEIKIAGVIAEQPALHKVEWLEASDNVPIYMMQGAADYDVPFEEGYLAGMTSYNGSSRQEDMGPFALNGSKSMYNRLKVISGNSKTQGHLSAFEGISHDISPMTNGKCQKLSGGLRGIWREAYAFAANEIKAIDTGTSSNFKTGYCFYKNPRIQGCNSVCE